MFMTRFNKNLIKIFKECNKNESKISKDTKRRCEPMFTMYTLQHYEKQNSRPPFVNKVITTNQHTSLHPFLPTRQTTLCDDIALYNGHLLYNILSALPTHWARSPIYDMNNLLQARN